MPVDSWRPHARLAHFATACSGLLLGALSILRTHAYAGCAQRDMAGELRCCADWHVDVAFRGGVAYARIEHAYALH